MVSGGSCLVNGTRQYRFIVIDSCFQQEVLARTGYIENYDIPIQIIKLYNRRGLNVISNLAAFYLYLYDCGFSLRHLILDDHLPNIEHTEKDLGYKKIYLPLLKKHRLRLHFGLHG